MTAPRETTGNATPIPEKWMSENASVYSEEPRNLSKLKPEDVARRMGGDLAFTDPRNALLTDATREAFIKFSTDEHGETHATIHFMGQREQSLDDTAVLLGENSATFVARGRYLPNNTGRLFEWFRLTRSGTSHHIERVSKYTPQGHVTSDIWNAAYDSSLRKRRPSES